MRHRFPRMLLLALASAWAAACSTPVGVYPKSAAQVHEELTRSVLSTGQLSPYTKQVLVRSGRWERHADEPEVVLEELRATLEEGLASGTPWELGSQIAFALAELNFQRAQVAWFRTRDRRARYFESARYAWAFLFPPDGAAGPGPFDPRLRIATDLYNRAVAEALTDRQRSRVVLADTAVALPGGSLRIDFREETLDWAGYTLADFRDAAKLGVRGILNRYRLPGLGAPLVASLVPTAASAGQRVPRHIQVPVTALLRFEGDGSELLGAGEHTATLSLFAADAASNIDVDGREVPLEYEGSSAFAATLSNELIWTFELQGFFQGDLAFFEERSDNEGLFFLHPYVPGRIPVVFVHGTASSAGRWADLVNEVLSVEGFRENFQPWLFTYNTGQPIAYSASLLRRSLRQTVASLDPAGRDPALQRLVVMGHSQGGLLTRLLVTDSGDDFWKLVSDRPIDELDLDPEARELLRAALFFEPLPFVDRVIFMCTPHRGSYLAAWNVSNWLRRFIRLPQTVSGAVEQLVSRNLEVLAVRSLESIPSSLDNMTPGHPFLVTLEQRPIAPGVHAHSIIAVKTDGPVEEGNDGVVEYRSAHLDGVDSEKVVHSGHSAQSNPETLGEVGRILLEHLAEAD